LSRSAPRLAYIVSRYPLVSHTFILREVRALRRAGARVDTYTVRRPSDDEVLSREDREEHAATTALLPPTPAGLAVAHARAFASSPRRYLSTLRLALAIRPPGPRAALWQLFYFAEAGLLWRRCRAAGTHHVHAHHANVASDVAMLAAALGGQGWTWSFTMHGPTELFDVRAHNLREKAERAQFVACVSEYARSQLMGLTGTGHWDKLRVVRCGLDLARFPPVDRIGRSGPAEILSVGRAVPVKGQSLLIRALGELARRGLDARLTLVGDGPELSDLRSLARDVGVESRVEFAGAVGQDEIAGHYARADLFAMPSFAEGLPVVLMEAMSAGLPVVASRITGIPELVQDGVSGALVAPGRLDDLVEALARMIEAGPDGRAAMGRAGRGQVATEFDVDRTSAELLAAFREFAAPS
jgi:colanic acid/amylovoran biosynthesis glycosyltransferase